MHTFSIWLEFLSVAGGVLSAAPQRREGAKKNITILKNPFSPSGKRPKYIIYFFVSYLNTPLRLGAFACEIFPTVSSSDLLTFCQFTFYPFTFYRE